MSAASDAFIARMKSAHVILVVDDVYYLIPFAALEGQFKMPDAFQKNAPRVDPDYFTIDPATAPAPVPGTPPRVIDVHRGIQSALDGVYGLDAIDQAVRVLDAIQIGGELCSKTGKSEKTLFKYTPGNRIVVDLSKGGKPSDI
jgi:hypothetical protein